MRLKLLARGTGPVPGSRGAAVRQGGLSRGLPPHLEEDVRLVGALAELFATVAAERLLNDDPTGHASGPTLPAIALAAGAALCVPLLERARRPGRRPRDWRDLVSGGARPGRRAPPSRMRRSNTIQPSTKGEGPHAYA